MAEFLETTGISHELTKLIKNSKDKLYLISPYLQTRENLRQRIKERDSASVAIKVVYRKDYKINADELCFLEELKNREVYCFENLHAKCYLNENTAIVASMNLYDYSQQNNREMGIKIEKKNDSKLYEDVFTEVVAIIDASEPVLLLDTKKVGNNVPIISKSTRSDIKNLQMNSGNGFCIRCGEKNIILNPEKPLCHKCYKIWEKHSNDINLKFRHCHACGKEYASTIEKPVCYSCYKKLSN